MAIIGEQNYGTPFGAIRPGDFFDQQGNAYYSYSGYTSRSGVTGFSGVGGAYTGFCGPSGLAFVPFTPALTYPLNYAILQGISKITWSAAAPTDPCDNNVTYEVQFTRSLSRKNGWRTISSSLKETFLNFDVSGMAYTEDGGFRVRARNSKGLFSEYSTTVEPFTISNHPPNPVKVVNPSSGQSIDNDMTVSWIEASPKDIDGHSVTYNIEFTSSFSSDTGWVIIPGGDNLPEGTNSFVADVFNLPDGNDYGVRVYAIDELGLAGQTSSVGPLLIAHSGSFIIDTIPPVGSFEINQGAVLAPGVDVVLNLKAFDAGTGIKDMRIGNLGDSCYGDWEAYSTEKFWKLPSSDGIKRVFVQFRDYAGNVSGKCDCEMIKRLLTSEGNVTSLKVYNDTLYIAFDQDGKVTSYRALLSDDLTLPEDTITAMEVFDGSLYIATYDGMETFLYSYNGKLTRIMSLAGERISSMQTYGDNLYMASVSGKIFEFTGDSVSISYSSTIPINKLKTDESLLYATVDIGGYFLTFNGAEWNTVST